jgi:hypothetical protein
MIRIPAAALAAATAAGGCASFSTVRSAEVHRGASVTAQASLSTPPGDDAAWFWAFDCTSACDSRFLGGDVGVTYGLRRVPVAVGVGLDPGGPYGDAYVQLGRGTNPFGVGGRATLLPLTGRWRQDQLYGRYDVRLGATTRLLLNPALFVHHGRTASELPGSRGSFVAFVQGVGLLFEGERASLVPAVTLVAGRTRRTQLFTEIGPTRTVFATGSLGVTFHRKR